MSKPSGCDSLVSGSSHLGSSLQLRKSYSSEFVLHDLLGVSEAELAGVACEEACVALDKTLGGLNRRATVREGHSPNAP